MMAKPPNRTHHQANCPVQLSTLARGAAKEGHVWAQPMDLVSG